MRQVMISGNKLSQLKSKSLQQVWDLNPVIVGKELTSTPCIVCSNVPGGMSTHAADGYLSIFIMQNEQKQER